MKEDSEVLVYELLLVLSERRLPPPQQSDFLVVFLEVDFLQLCNYSVFLNSFKFVTVRPTQQRLLLMNFLRIEGRSNETRERYDRNIQEFLGKTLWKWYVSYLILLGFFNCSCVRFRNFMAGWNSFSWKYLLHFLFYRRRELFSFNTVINYHRNARTDSIAEKDFNGRQTSTFSSLVQTRMFPVTNSSLLLIYTTFAFSKFVYPFESCLKYVRSRTPNVCHVHTLQKNNNHA